MKRVGLWVEGRVQGVGFRWWGQEVARRLGLTGTVRNNDDGRVEFHAQGPEDRVDELIRLATQTPPAERRPGRVDSWRVVVEPVIAGEKGFEIGFY